MRLSMLAAVALVVSASAATLENGVLRVDFDETNVAFSVVDLRTGRKWAQLPDLQHGVAVERVERADGEIRFAARAKGVDGLLRGSLALDGDTVVAKLDAPEDAAFRRGNDNLVCWPCPFAGEPGDRVLLPHGSGFSFPVEQTDMGERFDKWLYGYSREWRMAMWGQYAESVAADGEVIPQDGYLAIVDTPFNTIGTYRKLANGRMGFSLMWSGDLGCWGHSRKVRFVFKPKCGPMEMALEYREEMKRKGYYKTFAEKAAERPAMDDAFRKIAGSPSVWYWAVDGDKAGVCRALREECGFGDFLFQFAARKDLGTWVAPEEVKACAEAAPGVLLSEYDIYRDTMDSKYIPLIDYVRPYWSTDAADNGDIIRLADGSIERGWMVAFKGHADGSTNGIGCAHICEQKMARYVRKRLKAELAKYPWYNARYFDVMGCNPPGECYDSNHRMRRSECAALRREVMEIPGREFGLLSSTEDGTDYLACACDYLTCGFSAANDYRVDGGRWMWKIYDGDPPDEILRGTDEKTRMPIFEMVYHACVVSYWDWCDYNNKFPKIWWKRDLFNALCGTPPLYFFNEETWPRFKPLLKASYDVATPTAIATARSPMKAYRILTPDRSVHRTEFENGVACTVNFGDRPFTMKDGYVLGPRSHRLERSTTGREVAVLSDGWEFSQDRQSWRSIRVPHDWGVESDFDMAKYDGENGALPWKGVGWYRRTIVLDNELNGRRMSLAFDGVLADGVCFVNGEVAGRGEYGYLGFTADMTDYLFKGTNTIMVKADTTKLRSRWYPGAGMFRPVRLVETDDVYLEKEDLVVTTPEVSSSEARLLVKGTVVDRRGTEMPLAVRAELADPNGNVVAAAERSVNTVSWSKSVFEFDFKVSHPALWQMVDPAPLYTLRVSVKGQGVSDELSERVGFRSFRFEPDGGFFLNGRRGQIKGVNLHSDLGILGAAFDKSYARRQLKAMREMGANALRTSHNPPSPELLDLCDEMGVFVWNEAFDKWDSTSNRGEEPMEDFVSRNLRRFVRRDRNHPCVFVWSIGNEIPVGAGCAPGQQHWAGSPALGTSRERCALFRNAVREEDATRPVGIGSCDGKAVARGDYEPLDIVGWNYRGMYRPFRDKYPQKPAIYSESASAVSEFGWYSTRLAMNKTDYAIAEKRVDSYDRNAAPWSDIPDVEFWRMERDLDIGGEFVWTGTDYLGEPTPFNPHQVEWKDTPPEELARSSYFGINDLLHLPKDRTYLYRAHWRTDVLTLHIVPSHWNFDAGRRVPVYVYTSADAAELFLNGRSLGRRRKDKAATFDKNDYYGITSRYRLSWEDVPFESGELSCVAYDADGGRLGETSVRTAGEPTTVRLKSESDNLPSDGSLVFVRVSLGDANGVEVPGRRDRVAFSLAGPGEIVAVGNADPKGRQSFRKTDSYELFEGVAGIVLRRTGIGRIVLTARCGNMEQNALFD